MREEIKRHTIDVCSLPRSKTQPDAFFHGWHVVGLEHSGVAWRGVAVRVVYYCVLAVAEHFI